MLKPLESIEHLLAGVRSGELSFGVGPHATDPALSNSKLLPEISEDPRCKLIDIDRSEAGALIGAQLTPLGEEVWNILGLAHVTGSLAARFRNAREGQSTADVVELALAICEEWLDGHEALEATHCPTLLPLWPAGPARHV